MKTSFNVSIRRSINNRDNFFGCSDNNKSKKL